MLYLHLALKMISETGKSSQKPLESSIVVICVALSKVILSNLPRVFEDTPKIQNAGLLGFLVFFSP
jgi:hypothetical protein